MTEHVREVHTECDDQHCNVCNLYICVVCGGSEGSLLPECPGRRLTPEEDKANYEHYCKGTGPFAKVCDDCDGRGEVLDAPYNVLDGRAYFETCPTCNGTGRI